MASRWFGRLRRSPQEQAAATAARDGAVAAFLDLDTRQRFVTEAIQALRALEPGSRLIAEWKQTEQALFDATGTYVTTSNQFDPAVTGTDQSSFDLNTARAAFQQAHNVLAEAAKSVDAFYQRHRSTLDHASSALAATPRIAQDAVDEALRVRSSLSAQPAIAGFRSVQVVSSDLDAATAELDQALAANSATRVRDAANRIHAVAQEAPKVLQSAATAGARAATTLTAVRTRIDAVQSRLERLPQVRSALLREFSEPNSKDLVDNVASAEKELAQGRDLWQRAGATLTAGNAEDALDQLAAAREHLTRAATACDALTDRLEALNGVRADPAVPEQQARFRIRDAQRLVLDRGLVADWGSVLDAQSRRVDVARQKLVGPHPNYWAYLTELTSVTEFVRTVVDRIREQVEAAATNQRQRR